MALILTWLRQSQQLGSVRALADGQCGVLQRKARGLISRHGKEAKESSLWAPEMLLITSHLQLKEETLSFLLLFVDVGNQRSRQGAPLSVETVSYLRSLGGSSRDTQIFSCLNDRKAPG